MTVYVDGVLFLNFVFDFLLLLTTSIVLKRGAKLFNLMLGAFIGSLSTLVLFFDISSIQLFIIKVYLSILMNLVAFYYRDFKYTVTNIGVFYVVSILLGGFLYLLNIEFSYKHEGLVFYYDSLSINVVVLFIIAPFILYIYIRQAKLFQRKIKNYYKVDLFIGERCFSLNGYLDTGNMLSYKGKPVILTNMKNSFNNEKVLVPYTVIGGCGLLECINAKVGVEGLGYFDVLLGFSENMNISGVDILLNNRMEKKDD